TVYPPPPPSTPFPYTTLFRSEDDQVRPRPLPKMADVVTTERSGAAQRRRRDRLVHRQAVLAARHRDDERHRGRVARPRVAVGGRSEEHTSELQSQSNLVCRLL